MKSPKRKKSKDELELEDEPGITNDRPIPIEALAELTSSEVIAQVKLGMSNIEPLEFEDEFNEDAA